jgi:hypothetical protein
VEGDAASGSGTLSAEISNNTIGAPADVGSGSAVGNGIRINVSGNTHAVVLVDGNMIRQTPNGRGVEIIARNGTGGVDATVTDNDVNPQDLSGFPLASIFVESDCATVCNTLRSDIRGNVVPGVPATGELLPSHLVMFKPSGSLSILQLVDTPPNSQSCSAELATTNTGSVSTSAGCALILGPIATP